MRKHRSTIQAALASIALAAGLLLGAAQARAQEPALRVAPSTARPGQTVQVAISNLTAHAGTTLCLGILGPGRNVELGLTPAFRPRIGQVAIDAQGNGEAAAPLPQGLVPGSYRVIAGGCAPQPDLAPLATLASATVTVTGQATAGTTPTPSAPPRKPSLPASMPTTGGGGGHRLSRPGAGA